MFEKIYNISDQGIICDFGNEINKEINAKVIGVFNYINNNSDIKNELGIINCIPSYNKLIVQYDLLLVSSNSIIKYISSIKEDHLTYQNNQKKFELPICYDAEYGLDLASISKRNKISIEEIIHLHHETSFYVYMMGFMPGFPFMGDLTDKLFTSRLKTPRVVVPAKSVAIVEKFCAIYPFDSPGGWNIIGKTPSKLFEKNKKDPFLLYPGAQVKFKSISKTALLDMESEHNE
jgi:KipI family sensor histidine kinase inhibitor